jgi:hypothetical protein
LKSPQNSLRKSTKLNTQNVRNSRTPKRSRLQLGVSKAFLRFSERFRISKPLRPIVHPRENFFNQPSPIENFIVFGESEVELDNKDINHTNTLDTQNLYRYSIDSEVDRTSLSDQGNSSESTRTRERQDSYRPLDTLELDENPNMPPKPAPVQQPVLIDNRLIDAFKSMSMSNIPYNMLPRFSGERSGPSVDEIFERLNTLSTAYRWNDQDCAQIFRLCLEGDAAAIYDQLSLAVRSDWKLLVQEFKKAFVNFESASEARAQLDEHKKKVDEGWHMYAKT